MAHDVTLITGDGTGPELSEAARKCIDATGVKINWDVQEAGIDVMARTGTPIPDSTLASIRRTRCALKAPITTPVGTVSEASTSIYGKNWGFSLYSPVQVVRGSSFVLQRMRCRYRYRFAKTPKIFMRVWNSKQ